MSTEFLRNSGSMEEEMPVVVRFSGDTFCTSPEVAGTIGPLIEIPVLVGLVYAMLWLGPKLFPNDPSLPSSARSTSQIINS